MYDSRLSSAFVVHKVPLPQLPRECDVSKNKNIVCSRASNDGS